MCHISLVCEIDLCGASATSYDSDVTNFNEHSIEHHAASRPAKDWQVLRDVFEKPMIGQDIKINQVDRCAPSRHYASIAHVYTLISSLEHTDQQYRASS